MIDISRPTCPVARKFLQTQQGSDGEGKLLLPLLEWASRTGRIREDTRIAAEVPFNGRRIDLVTLTRSGVLTAYELKLGSVNRALEQAWYNRRRFSRSFAVLAHVPGRRYLEMARHFEVGIIAIVDGHVRQIVPSSYRPLDSWTMNQIEGRLSSVLPRVESRVRT